VFPVAGKEDSGIELTSKSIQEDCTRVCVCGGRRGFPFLSRSIAFACPLSAERSQGSSYLPLCAAGLRNTRSYCESEVLEIMLSERKSSVTTALTVIEILNELVYFGVVEGISAY
jgi:hypothetical protein